MLRLNSVASGYDENLILKNISLELKRGEILALIGLNGSGKSTLLRTMLGLLMAQKGEVHWNAKLLKDIDPKERASLISLLDARMEIGFPMTVGELMDIHSRFTTMSPSLTKEALEATGLSGYEERNILKLSSGEAKRAFIAHTLATESQVMLLDEPFAHLDWSHQADLTKALKNWRDKKTTTFVLAIHELEWAVQIADRIALLDRGEIIALDTPEKVFSSPRVCEVFAFQTRIDENPIDGSRRLTLGRQ